MNQSISINSNLTDCPSCKENASQPVLDTHTGDLICTSCGLVLQSQCIDESQEWRDFAPESAHMGDRDYGRTRGDITTAGSALMGETDIVYGTSITGTSPLAQLLQRAQQTLCQSQTSSAEKKNQHLKVCDARVRAFGARLGLDGAIMRRSAELLHSLWKSGNLPAVCKTPFHLAIIYIACKEEDVGRTYKELAATSAGGRTASEKTIAGHVSKLTKVLGDELSNRQFTVRIEEMLPRFINRLGLSPQQVSRPAAHVTRGAIRYGFAPNSRQAALVGASILIVAWLLNVEVKPSFENVGVATRCTEKEVECTYSQLVPRIRTLLADLPGFICRLPGGHAGLPKAKKKSRRHLLPG